MRATSDNRTLSVVPGLIWRGCLVAAIVSGAGMAASAQVEGPQRMTGGLFGRQPNLNAQTFDVTVSSFGAFDDNVLADQRVSLADPVSQRRSGVYAGLDAGAAYRRPGRTFDFRASGGTDVRYYPTLRNAASMGRQGAVAVSVHGQKTRATISQSIAYSPYYMLVPFPAAVPHEPGDVAFRPADATVYRRDANAYDTAVNVEQSWGARSLLSLIYDRSNTVFSGDNSTRTTYESAGGRYSHQLTSGAGVHLGYVHHQADLTAAPRAVTHDLDVGLDYNKPLSISRRTTVGFSMGSAIVEQAGARSYRVIGDASLNHEMGRTWNARAVYHRGMGIIETLNTPYFADAVTANVQGSITRRLDLRTVAAYTNGDLGFAGPSNTFVTSTASSRLRFAFSPNVATYVEYAFFRYDFANPGSLPLGFPPRIDRHSLHAGLTLWLPVYR